jgi:hypothetical protein
MAMHRFDLIRDILDKQLVDGNGTEMGRIDGIIIEVRDGAPPRVDHFELGFTVLAERMHARLERWFRAARRWSVRRTTRQIVPWSAVEEVTQHHVKLDLDAEKTPAFDWERWLRKHIVHRLPGGKPEE